MDSVAPGAHFRGRALQQAAATHPLALVPAALGLAWAALLAARGLGLHRSLGIPAYDTAYFQQLTWGITNGHVFHASFLAGNFLGLHFSPLLVIPAALELVWPGAPTLTMLGALSLGMVVPATYLATRTILPQTRRAHLLAVGLSIVLPLSPPLQEAAWSSFHPELMALPALLFAAWAGLTDRRWLAMGLVAVALMAKEDVAYQVVVVGALLVVAGGTVARRRLGAGVMAVGTVWGTLVLLVVMPLIRGGTTTDIASYYAWLRTARLPQVAAALAVPQPYALVLLSLLALGLLPLLRPGFALLAVPPFIAAVLSRHHSQSLLQLQYALPLALPLVLGAALGGRRFLAWTEHRPVRRPAYVAASLMAAAAVVVAATGSVSRHVVLQFVAASDVNRQAAARQALTLVPAAAEVDLDDDLAAPAASRASLHLLPHLSPQAFVLVDAQGSAPGYSNSSGRDRAVRELPQRRRLLFSDAGVQLWSPQT
ncbi:MAG: DUF2079 domain-containing protein [Candidatus Dormibacteria bacterium]